MLITSLYGLVALLLLEKWTLNNDLSVRFVETALKGRKTWPFDNRALYMVYTATVTLIPLCEETAYPGDSV